jgi:zeta-carotene desaturase
LISHPDNPKATASTLPKVIVVGGGLAGMATAVALQSAGARVTLLEARKNLGGRAASYEHPTTGEELDNCQHVLLGCCTNLMDFYGRLNVRHLIGFHHTVHFLDAKGRRYDLQRTVGLPAPLHLGPAMLRFSVLSWSERLALSRAMLALMRISPAEREALGNTAFGDWLREHRQSPALVHKLYEPILIGALNDACERSSSKYAIQVLQESLLNHADGYVLGLPRCPLSQLYASLPIDDLRLGTRVRRLQFNGSAASGVMLQNSEVLHGDAVVLATNHHTIGKWIPPELQARDRRFAMLDRLESMPILGAHLLFDRPVLRESHAALIDGPLQWLFRKDADGCAVHGVISAAQDWVDRDRDECVQLFTNQLRQTLPMARDTRLIRSAIVVEKRATFVPSPGVDRWRPQQAPDARGIANLFLAGDYTQTGWPATMEGAVRSGYLAAEAVLRLQGWQNRFIVPNLPQQWPSRLLEWIGKNADQIPSRRPFVLDYPAESVSGERR